MKLTGSVAAMAAILFALVLYVAGALDAHATNPPSMDAMLIDMDPEDGDANPGTFTPVNTSSVRGTNETCARINENDTLDADEDVTTDTLTIDTTATNIPAANAIIGYQYYLLYNETNLTVQSQTANVAATNILARTPGSNLFNVSDPAPDTDGNNTWLASVLDIGPAAGESGSGVLDRLTVSSDAGATSPVVENLSLANAVHLDVGGGAWFPDNANWDSDGDTLIDGVQNVARIALNTGCPGGPTPTATPVPSPTSPPTATPVATPTPTGVPSSTPALTPTPTATPHGSGTPTPTGLTPTPTLTPAPTTTGSPGGPALTPTATPLPGSPTDTPADTPVPTPGDSPTPAPTSMETPVGDSNCDGEVDAVDALMILRHVAGLPVNLPPGCPAIGS